MENFGIAARGLSTAIDLLAHPSIIAKGEVMEWFMTTDWLYEEFDAQLQASIQIVKEGITAYYIRLRAYLKGTEEGPPPRINSVPEVLVQRIAHLREVKRHKVGRYIINDQDAGLTHCSFEIKTAIELQVVTIDNNLKRLGQEARAACCDLAAIFAS